MVGKMYNSKKVRVYTSRELNEFGKDFYEIMVNTGKGFEPGNKTKKQIDLVNKITTSMLPILENIAFGLNNNGSYELPYFRFAFEIAGYDAEAIQNTNIPLSDIIHEGACQVVKKFHNYDPYKSKNGSVYSFVLYQAGARMVRYILEHIPNGITIADKIKNSSRKNINEIKLPYVDSVNLDDITTNIEGVQRNTALEREYLTSNENPKNDLRSKQLQIQTAELLHTLDTRERFIIEHRHCLNGCREKWALGKLGKRLGIVGERVRQIQGKAEEKLKKRAPRELIELIR